MQCFKCAQTRSALRGSGTDLGVKYIKYRFLYQIIKFCTAVVIIIKNYENNDFLISLMIWINLPMIL